MCVLSRFSRVWLFATTWTAARQAPLSMAFSRQEYWSGLPCPPPGDLPQPGIEPEPLMSPALADEFFTTSITWEALMQSERCPRHPRKNRKGAQEKELWWSAVPPGISAV